MPSVDLCLACSSSLPPRWKADKHEEDNAKYPFTNDDVFVTECCRRAICPTCISANPRLARYNPCIQCLGGADVMSSRTLTSGDKTTSGKHNIDGGVHDEDVFALGDDEESDDEVESSTENAGLHTPPPAYTEEVDTAGEGEAVEASNDAADVNDEPALEATGPQIYYIQPSDSLLGISLRLGVDGHLLCKLNSLPPSTLRTTPHLLHTRTTLLLPPSSRSAPSLSAGPLTNVSQDELEAREVRRARERATARFQGVTKETDHAVTRAYIALAESSAGGSDPPNLTDGKAKDLQPEREPNGLEGRAIDQYMDDEEWEARERREGRDVHIPRFPLSPSNTQPDKQKSQVARGKLFSRGWKWM